MLDKHVTPNLVALVLIGTGLLTDAPAGPVILSVGLFALSGALTNWLAVHMLFERVPGLYGSGIIPLHFEEFKAGILKLVREELFGEDKVERLFEASLKPVAGDAVSSSGNEVSTEATAGLSLEPLLDGIDLDAAFDQLVITVTESSFGNMLQMVGGEQALQPLRRPFMERMRRFLGDAAKSPRVQEIVRRQLTSEANRVRFRARLETLLKARLDELTPDMVRDLMQRLIRRHLGWLVVWGGVFGGAIGLVAGLARLA